MTPLFKSGKQNQVENYRPISILPTVAKIFKQWVHRQLYSFLIENNFLHPCQHGFRTKRSTHTALLSVVDKWLEGMDNGHISVVVLLDLAKSFDTISHPELLTENWAPYELPIWIWIGFRHTCQIVWTSSLQWSIITRTTYFVRRSSGISPGAFIFSYLSFILLFLL